MGLIQPEAKNLCRENCLEHPAEECSVLLLSCSMTNHMRSRQQNVTHDPCHSNTSPQNSAAQVKLSVLKKAIFLFFLFAPSLPKKSPNKARKMYLNSYYHRHIKIFAGYGFVFTIFSSNRNCKCFVSIIKTKLFNWCICFFLFFLPGVSCAVKEQFFSE